MITKRKTEYKSKCLQAKVENKRLDGSTEYKTKTISVFKLEIIFILELSYLSSTKHFIFFTIKSFTVVFYI